MDLLRMVIIITFSVRNLGGHVNSVSKLFRPYNANKKHYAN